MKKRLLQMFHDSLIQEELVLQTTASGETSFLASNVTGRGTPRFELDGEMLGYPTTTFTRTLDGSPKVVRILSDFNALQAIRIDLDAKLNNLILDLSKWNTVATLDIRKQTGLMQEIILPDLSNVQQTSLKYQFWQNTELLKIDASKLSRTLDTFDVALNNKLTTLILPNSMTLYDNSSFTRIYDNPKLTSIDLSAFKKIGANIQLQNNALLETLTLPTSGVTGNNISVFYAYSLPKITSLDLSGLAKLGGDIRIYGNTLMETLTFPTTLDSGVNNTSVFFCYNNPELTHDLDLTMFTKLGNNIQIYNIGAGNMVNFPTTMDSNAPAISLCIFTFNAPTKTLDLSNFEKFSGSNILQMYNNNVYNIIFPTTLITDTFTGSLGFQDSTINDSGGTLDISCFQHIRGALDFERVNGLRNVIHCSTHLGATRTISLHHRFTNINIDGDYNFDVLKPFIASLKFQSCGYFNQELLFGQNDFFPTSINLISSTGGANNMSWTTAYNSFKSLYDNRGTYQSTVSGAKTIYYITNGLAALVAPTGYVQGANGTDPVDGTITTPTDDASRQLAIREMFYVLVNQKTNANPSLSKYNWTISI